MQALGSFETSGPHIAEQHPQCCGNLEYLLYYFLPQNKPTDPSNGDAVYFMQTGTELL